MVADKDIQFLKGFVTKKEAIQIVQRFGGGSSNSNDKGYFATESALTTAYPTGENGWYAVVGSTDTIWIWDSSTGEWLNSGTSSSIPQSQSFTSQTSVTVTHNLGYKPLVQVINGSGGIIEVVINHINTSSFSMTSNVPISGTLIYY